MECGLFSFLAFFTIFSAAARAEPRVESFSPQGMVKGVRQVAVRFSEPMRPFGDLRGPDPFLIHCAAPGRGRWADDRRWVYDFDADLPGGRRCTFTLRPGARALSGAPVAGLREFSFWTGGPSIMESRPYEGATIAEDQAFILGVDGEPTEASVRARVRFAVDGLPEALEAQVVAGARAKRLRKAAGWPENSPAIVIQARRAFPSGKKVRLIWGRGVRTADGAATTQDQTLAFVTRPAFTAALTCQRADANSGCLPFLPVELEFSAPVRWSLVRRAVVRGPGGRTWSPAKPGSGDADAGKDGERWVGRVVFKGLFPADAPLTLELPPGLLDDAGRPLDNAGKFPLAFKTDDYPPLAKFSAPFGILELKTSPVLPVTLRNLEPEVRARLLKVGGPAAAGALGFLRARFFRSPPDPKSIMERLNAVYSAASGVGPNGDRRGVPLLSKNEGSALEIPKPEGAKAFEVVGIPLKKPGFYVVELESRRLGQALLGRDAPMYVPTAALVTDLSVHLKRGRESSLVWVTSLDSGLPEAGAKVSIADANGKILWRGETDAQGIARPTIPADSQLPEGHPWRLMALAERGGDYAFTFDSWTEGIEPWRFQVPFDDLNRRGDVRKTVLDRPLFRAGETVHMKHFLRRQTTAGFALPPKGLWPAKAVVEQEGSRQRWELPLNWSADGTAVSEWTIPKEAKLGVYDVVLPDAGPSRDWYDSDETAASFRVEEFRLPMLKATIQTPSEPLVAVSSVPVQLSVRYLSGGAAARLPVVLRAQLQPAGARQFEDFDGFSFGAGPVPAAQSPRAVQPAPPVRAQELSLDLAGSAQTLVAGAPDATAATALNLELEYRDPSGETQTASASATLWPSARLVGLKSDTWAMSAKTLHFQAAVVDLKGRPAAGAPVSVELVERRYRAFRKRLVGGFYAYDQSNELVRRGEVCRGVTDARGLLDCRAQSPASGNVVLEARTEDAAGRPSWTNMDVWVAGEDDWWFDAGDSDRMDVLPQKPRYEPGQTALFQVRMPFRAATALVTVEREGVMDAFVTRLSGKSPTVEIPIRSNYSPNVFVSVLAVRGRAAQPQPTALVDLGRPAYRLGLAQIRVGWDAHELKVRVAADQAVYKVRGKARVSVTAATPDGRAPEPGAEAAVAVVDQALLELAPNETWKLLDAMMSPRGLAVMTATAQMYVVGKRHFGLKALPAGGGGGRTATRELFDTLLYWNPRVKLDANGRATVEVPLNDSISRFAVAAVVDAGLQRFGTGTASFRTTQDLAVLPGVAPLVREGDEFEALFTARNSTARAMEVAVAGTVEAGGVKTALADKTLHLAAGESAEFSWRVRAAVGVSSQTFAVSAAEPGGTSDRVRVVQKVEPAVPVRVLQAELAQIDGALSLPVAAPTDALPGRGGVRVSLSPSLAGDMSGLVDYMRAYPYSCLEQRASKAVALRDAAAWAAAMDALPSYLDGDGLAKFFPSMEQGSAALTAYLISLADEAGWDIPAGPKDRMTQALRAFVEGKIERGGNLPTSELAYRKLAAAAALSRLGALPENSLQSLPTQPQLWPTSAVLDWRIIQSRASSPQAPARLAEADQILRSRLNAQGTTLGLSDSSSRECWCSMASADADAARLVLATLGDPSWKSDAPLLLRGALARQVRGHWDLTTANAWGRLALEKFAKSFEAGPVDGRTTASLGGAAKDFSWSGAPSGGAVELPWPAGPAALSLRHDGAGKPWATVQSRAAVPLSAPLSSGYKIEKTLTAVARRAPGRWSRGDIVRVRVKVSAQSDMGWVVVDDPIPGGASILGTGLGRDSALATQGERDDGDVWPAFQERSFEAFRSYYEFVPKGDFSLEYTVRLNNPGDFGLPPTRVEAMYAPEMFGELPNPSVTVDP